MNHPLPAENTKGRIGRGTRKLKGDMLGSFKFRAGRDVPRASRWCRSRPRSGDSARWPNAVSRRGADDRLEAGFSAALAAFEDERDGGQVSRAPRARPGLPGRVGGRRPGRDRAARSGNAVAPGRGGRRLRVGASHALGAPRPTVSLVGPGGRAATIVAAVPLTRESPSRLHARSGLGGARRARGRRRAARLGGALRARRSPASRRTSRVGSDRRDRRPQLSRVSQSRLVPGQRLGARCGHAERR